jgi:hypothetical protein
MRSGSGWKLAGAGAMAGLAALLWRRLTAPPGDEHGRDDRIVAAGAQVDAAAAGDSPPPPPASVTDPAAAPAEGAAVTDEPTADPLVDEETAAAASEAAAIGGDAAVADQGFGGDPAMRPVAEGSGDAQETLEAEDREAPAHREKRR